MYTANFWNINWLWSCALLVPLGVENYANFVLTLGCIEEKGLVDPLFKLFPLQVDPKEIDTIGCEVFIGTKIWEVLVRPWADVFEIFIVVWDVMLVYVCDVTLGTKNVVPKAKLLMATTLACVDVVCMFWFIP